MERLIERECDCDWLLPALRDSTPLPLMLRLCDCDWLLNADVLCSFERDIERECDRLIDGFRDPLFEMDVDCDMDCERLCEGEACVLTLLLCETD